MPVMQTSQLGTPDPKPADLPEATAPSEHALPHGYPRLAKLMGRSLELAIFRRFTSLNILNILSIQAELMELQADLGQIQLGDYKSQDATTKQLSEYFHILRNSSAGADGEQYQQLVRIREKLQEYNSTVLQVAQMLRLEAPLDGNLDYLRNWLESVVPGKGGRFLHGVETWTWTPSNKFHPRERDALEKDFFTLHAKNSEQDMFSEQLSSTLLDGWILLKHLWRAVRTRITTRVQDEDLAADHDQHAPRRPHMDPESGILYISNSRLLRLNNILVSVLSSALPVLTVVALYFIKNTGKRIAPMAGFTILFALALAVFTNARRLEIFASTAARVRS